MAIPRFRCVRKTDKEVFLKSSNGGIFTFKRHQVAEIHESNPPEADAEENKDQPVWLREAAVGRDLFRRVFGKSTLVIPRTCQKVLGLSIPSVNRCFDSSVHRFIEPSSHRSIDTSGPRFFVCPALHSQAPRHLAQSQRRGSGALG